MHSTQDTLCTPQTTPRHLARCAGDTAQHALCTLQVVRPASSLLDGHAPLACNAPHASDTLCMVHIQNVSAALWGKGGHTPVLMGPEIRFEMSLMVLRAVLAKPLFHCHVRFACLPAVVLAMDDPNVLHTADLIMQLLLKPRLIPTGSTGGLTPRVQGWTSCPCNRSMESLQGKF